MPHKWNNTLVVTKDELVPVWWSSINTLYSEIQRYKNKSYGIKRAQLGGNGRQLLVAFNSLPREVQDGIGDPRKVKHILERFYKIDSKAIEFYTNFQYPEDSYLTPEAQERYIVNASMVASIFRLEKARKIERLTKGGSLKAITVTLCTDAITFQEVLKRKHNIQHSLPKHPRHFKNTLTKFTQLGYISLIKDAKGKSKQNARKATEDIIKLLNDLFATQPHKPTATEVARQYEAFLSGYLEVINNETGEVYPPKGMSQLSPSTIKLYLAGWENKIETHTKRSGDRQKLMQQFKPYQSLEQPKLAGSLISIDDRQPPFEYLKGKRMWFYNGIHLASEAFTCWVYGKSKGGIILDFYRQLIRNYAEWGLNLPDGLECESSLNSSFKNTFLREGAMFQNVRIEANNARGKRIEAYYKHLRYDLEKKREGWLARPFAISEPNQLGSNPKITVPYNEIIEGCLHDIETWNNMEHSKNKGISRWEYFLQNQNSNLKPTNYKAILPHLGYKTETSCHAGIIRLQYQKYLLSNNGKIYLGESLIQLMKQVEGKELDIYWLDDNKGNVLKALICFRGEKRYICEARPKPIYNRAIIEQTEKDKEAPKTMSSYVSTIEAFQKQQTHSLGKITVLENQSYILNNKFQIEALKKQAIKENEKVEILEPIETDEYNLIPDQLTFKKDLKDRF